MKAVRDGQDQKDRKLNQITKEREYERKDS